MARESAGLYPTTFAEERHVNDLTRLADYVAGLSLADQRLYALYSCQASLGRDLDGECEPGPSEAELLARIGGDHPAPTDASDTLDELVAAAVEDVVADARATQSRLRDELRLARRDAEQLDLARAQTVEAEQAADRLREELGQVRAELEQTTAQRDHFSAFFGRQEKPAQRARATATRKVAQ